VGGIKSAGVLAVMEPRIIDNDVSQWCQRLRACVHAERGNFDDLL